MPPALGTKVRGPFHVGPVEVGLKAQDNMARLNLGARRSTEYAAGKSDGLTIEAVRDQIERVLMTPAAAAVQTKINPGPVVDWRGRQHRGRRQACAASPRLTRFARARAANAAATKSVDLVWSIVSPVSNCRSVRNFAAR